LTRTTVSRVDADPADDMAPPQGTAIVRPLRHVRDVRDRYSQRFTDPGQIAASRAARAWAWALGETATAPVTDRETALPPSRLEIEAEITVADERRLRGDRENRADAAATVLRWLIGNDDHVPVRGTNLGALVGGFGDIVRPREQIANVLAAATEGHRQAVAKGRESSVSPARRQSARRDAEYRIGVTATLKWVVGQRARAPITSQRRGMLTATQLKAERLHAEDVIEQPEQPWAGDLPHREYGEGVKSTINWLLGDSAIPPVHLTWRSPRCSVPLLVQPGDARE
jgi:hypothetical protein